MHNLYLHFHYVCELCEKCSFHLSNYKKSNDYRMKKMAYINNNLKKTKKDRKKALQKGEGMVI